MHRIDPAISSNKCIKSIKEKQYYKNYSEDGYSIDFGIFSKRSRKFLDISWPKTGKTFNVLKKIAKKAFQIKSSGSRIHAQNGKKHVDAWHFIENSPMIIVAKAVIENDTNFLLLANLIPLLMLLYLIFLVLLLGDLLSYIFLLPVKTLKKGFSVIKSGHFSVKVEIPSGDEFQKMAVSFNKMANGLLERERMKRFVSDKLYESIDSEQEQAQKTKVAVLSSDVRDFTNISESVSPVEIVSLLNNYIEEMESCILEFDGSIEKIIGDAIVAGFYPKPGEKLNYAARACKAALAMRKKLKAFNNKRTLNGNFTIENGIGISTGEAQLGAIGKQGARKDFIIIGNVIEDSEKLEAETKCCNDSKVLIDEETKKLVQDSIKFKPNLKSNIQSWELISPNE
jgi:class 3 adenylate cyclase